MSINNLHIPTKMSIPAITAILCMLAIAVIGNRATSEQSHLLDSLFNRSFAREAEVQLLTDNLTVVHATLYRTMILSAAHASQKAIDDEITDLTANLAKVSSKSEKFKQMTSSNQDEQAIFAKIHDDVSSYIASVSSFIDLLGVGVDPLDFLKELQSSYDKLSIDCRDFTAYERQRSVSAYGAVNTTVQALTTAFFVVAAVALLVTVGVALWIGFNVARPIIRLTKAMEWLAAGHNDAEIPASNRGDEIGSMARAVQVFKENAIRVEELSAEQEAMRKKTEADQRETMNRLALDFDATVKSMLNEVLSSARSMQTEARAMLDNAQETSHHSDSVVHSAQQATAEVESVAAGAEQLQASINEITRAITQSADFARNAVAEVDRTDDIVQGLAHASRKIGEVVGLISSIASQTNLLALNATIEAARAGEAGKGFAVVANEVKHLANQTARATEEIENEIAGVQAATGGAVNAIRAIASTIQQVNQSLGTVATAVEEQGAATSDISERSQRAASGTIVVLEEMKQVQTAAETTGKSAIIMQKTTEGLSSSFNQLDREVEAFIRRITQ